MGGELFHTHGQKGDTRKVMVTSRNFVNVSENEWSYNCTPSIRLYDVDRNTFTFHNTKFLPYCIQSSVLLCCYFWMTLVLEYSLSYYGFII